MIMRINLYSSILLGLTSSALATVFPQLKSFPKTNPRIENRTLDQIYAAAQHETGELTVLWGGDEIGQGVPTIKAWNSRFPNVKLNLTVDVSKYHDSRIDRQFQKNGSDGADIAVLQTVQDFVRWKREGRLLPYKPTGWKDIYASLKDNNGAYFSPFVSQFGSLIYNNDKLNKTDLPSSYAAFVDPFWKGKLVLTYPNDDDAVAYLFSVIIDRYGWEWFEAIARQDVQWIRGTGQPADVTAADNTTRQLSFTTNLNGSPNLAEKVLDEPRLLWPQTAAIMASTTRPESAKLFMSWLNSDEYQQMFASQGQYLTVKDLNSTAGSVWLDPNSGLSHFGTFMGDRANVEWWRLQFETTIGTPQGVSPVLSALGSRP